VTSDPDFKVTTLFEVEYLKNDQQLAGWTPGSHSATVRGSNPGQVLGSKLLYHTNRKPYLTYRMVPCLVTLTDL